MSLYGDDVEGIYEGFFVLRFDLVMPRSISAQIKDDANPANTNNITEYRIVLSDTKLKISISNTFVSSTEKSADKPMPNKTPGMIANNTTDIFKATTNHVFCKPVKPSLFDMPRFLF